MIPPVKKTGSWVEKKPPERYVREDDDDDDDNGDNSRNNEKKFNDNNNNNDNYWPETHPLPIPKWSKSKGSFCVSSVEQYEELAASVELTVQQLIQAHNYNTVGNFIRYENKVQ